MDLATIDLTGDANAGAWCQLYNPKNTAQKLPVRIRALGNESDRWNELVNEQAEKQRRLANEGRAPALTVATLEEVNRRFLAEVTTAWQTFDGKQWQDWIEFNGQRHACSAANARMLYAARPWIQVQLMDFKANPANFGEPVKVPVTLAEYDGEVEKNSSPGLHGATVQAVAAGASSSVA